MTEDHVTGEHSLTIEGLLQRFDVNLKRAERLAAPFSSKESDGTTSRESDIIRAAVVLLHASLEDFLRDLQLLTLHSAPREALKRYRLPIGGGRELESFTVADLARFRHLSVADLIYHSAEAHHSGRSTFNRTDHVVVALRSSGVTEEQIAKLDFSIISEMMNRRHDIVHRADRKEGTNKATKIAGKTVHRYIAEVRHLRGVVKRALHRDEV